MRNILTSLFCIMCAVCFSAPVKSNLGAKSLEYIEGETAIPTASDYVLDGLVAMWDGIENAGWGVHDENATKLFELVSGQIDYGVASTFVANEDSMEVAIDNSNVLTQSRLGVAVSNAISRGYAHIEAVVFPNALGGIIYGNRVQIVDGSFGWQYRTGCGGLSMFSSGWVVVTDTSTINEDKVRLAIDIDANNSTVTYQVGTQSSGPRSITITSYRPVARISDIGTKVFNIRAYDKPLSEEEISHNKAIDKIRFNLP